MNIAQPVKSEPSQIEELSDEAAAGLVNRTKWYHRFELRPGLVSPGETEIVPLHAANALSVPEDLSNKSLSTSEPGTAPLLLS